MTLGAELVENMKKGLKEKGDYNPYQDDSQTNLEIKFGNQLDMWKQEKEKVDQAGLIALDQKKMGLYDRNDEGLKAAYGTDPDVFYKSVAKFHTGDEKRTDLFPIYGGVGLLRTKDTTPWDTNTIKYVNSIKLPQKGTDIGGGKVRTIEGLTPEEIESAADTFMVGEGGKNAESLNVQAQANNPTYNLDLAQKEVRKLFVDRMTQRNRDNLKGGQARLSFGEKKEEQYGFSPYSTKGKSGEANGFNVRSLYTNTGMKSNLQSGDETLDDVDVKTVFVDDNGRLRAIVQERITEVIPMTEDERKAEIAKAKTELRKPNFETTKTKTKERPREINFEVGSNNYNTIMGQYPVMQEKVAELLKARSVKPKSEAKSFDYSKAGMEVKAKELKITVGQLRAKILAKKPTATFE